MNDIKNNKEPSLQKILIVQQDNKGESKIKGVREYGENLFDLEIFDINEDLPHFIDKSDQYLPDIIEADMVLDFLKHPDLSEDLAKKCEKQNIPIVASGKKTLGKWSITPPT